MNLKPVLIVEDDDDIREQLQYALEIEGYRVLQAVNGLRALELLKALAPHDYPGCILLDLMMPVMDGITFLETIARDHRELTGIKVVIASAKGSPIDTSRVPQVLERIRKPMDLEELYRVVAIHCGKN